MAGINRPTSSSDSDRKSPLLFVVLGVLLLLGLLIFSSLSPSGRSEGSDDATETVSAQPHEPSPPATPPSPERGRNEPTPPPRLPEKTIAEIPSAPAVPPALPPSETVETPPPPPSRIPEPTQTRPPANAVADANLAAADLFADLRNRNPTGIRHPDWDRIAAQLEHLKTIDGASVDPVTGQLVLYGAYTSEKGPLEMDDILVALQGAFAQNESVGMTLDEDPDNKEGPWMLARYFGGCENTHFGQAMFDFDRLMKCLSQGKDNITGEPLRPRVENFHTMAEFSAVLKEPTSNVLWNRFWANLSTGRFPTNDLNGKPLVEPSTDGNTIWLTAHRVFVDTEQMLDPGKGKRLKSSGMKQSRSALAFADQLTAKYDDLAKEYPTFAILKELSKLVVIAEWIRDHNLPLDPELLYTHASRKTTTPLRTPTLATTNEWQEGRQILRISILGGVTLDPRAKYIVDREKNADALADSVARFRSEVRKTGFAEMPGKDKTEKAMLGFGPAARGPRDPAQAFPLEANRCHITDKLIAPIAANAPDPVLKSLKLPVYMDPARGEETHNFPILREFFGAHHDRSITFSLPDGSYNEIVRIPDQLSLTSPLRDIDIRFETKPLVDNDRQEAYFPTRTPGIKGYYPKSRTLRMEDGKTYHFNPEGTVARVEMPGTYNYSFKHSADHDASVYFNTIQTPGMTSRGPPQKTTPFRLLMTEKNVVTTRKAPDVPGSKASILVEIVDEASGKKMDVRRDEGKIYHVALN